MMRPVVFLDVDGTLFRGNINYTVIWQLFRMRIASPFLLMRAGLWWALWQIGFIDLENVARHGANELKGISKSKMDRALDSIFQKYIAKNFFEEAKNLIEQHRKLDHEIILLSASYEPFIAKVAQYFYIQKFMGTKLEIQDGKYTGKILGKIVGGNKHKIAEEYLHYAKPEETYAYTDHFQDMLLLDMVTYPVVVNPDEHLRDCATRRNWRILTFSAS